LGKDEDDCCSRLPVEIDCAGLCGEFDSMESCLCLGKDEDDCCSRLPVEIDCAGLCGEYDRLEMDCFPPDG